MNDQTTIEGKLAGCPETRRRRAELLAELACAFADSGPQVVTDDVTHRMDTLVETFTHQLRELKKQL